MTDQRPETPGDPLPDQLAGWFEREVRQAAADLRAAPLAGPRPRSFERHTPVAPAAAAILVVIVVVAGLARLPGHVPGTGPTGGSPAQSDRPAITDSPDPAGSPAVSGRYDDGIPEVLSGEPVLRPSALRTAAPADDRSFLLGGWILDYRHIVVSCPAMLGTPPPFGPRCGTPYVTDAPYSADDARVALDRSPSDLGGGPVVFRVHRHDSMAARCDAERRTACEAMAVLESVVWAGDEVTATAPLTPTEVFTRLTAADPTVPLGVTTPLEHSADPGRGSPRPSGRAGGLIDCPGPFPELSWSIASAAVSYVLVFPTAGARETVDQDLTPSGWISSNGCMVTTDALYIHEWVAVDNVMVAVNADVDGPTPAQARLVTEVRSVLSR